MLETLPGAAFPDVLRRQLAEAARAKDPAYRARTHHGDRNLPRYTNRLILERSPYLLQHAHNPVSWWPWGEEPFEEARRTGRPVFLSVGYSTCHWCHVMEEESFEDLEIARMLNERYVAIKVDREERPDVDALYMSAVQLLRGGGGWPMSVWLTPDKEPFFAGTYYPPRDGVRGMARGFLGILEGIADLYAQQPDRVRGVAISLMQAVGNALSSRKDAGADLPGPEPIEDAVSLFAKNFDDQHGGLIGAPKFPSGLPVRLLFRHHRRTRDPNSLRMATLTLEKMAAGGIHDQIGGGFHRYSTDAEWLVPHFEKMLYDNALLALAYAEAWQVTQRREMARVVRQTLDYLLREMTSPEGGLYSATDADSEGREGRFFVWEEREIRELLGADSERFIQFHGVRPEGNFEGRSILWVPRPDESEWDALASARARLYEARSRRVPPFRDEKVVAAWNGLAISALAFGGRVLAESRYVGAAIRAAEFVLDRMFAGDRLLRTWLAGEAGVAAFLQDHAFLVAGLLDLHEATFDPRWLVAAVELSDRQERLFADGRGGGWFTSAEDQNALLVREKPMRDGAEPSGASVALLNALRLYAFTTDQRWWQIAERALRAYAPSLKAEPTSFSEMLVALDFATDAAHEVVLVWPEGEPPPEAFVSVLRQSFLPNRALCGAAEGDGIARLGNVAPVAAGKVAAGRPTAYVCEKGLCKLPAIAPEKLASQIAPAHPYH